MKKLYALALLFLYFVSTGQVNIIPGNTVTQNFDAMGSSSTLPANWKMAASTASPQWATAASSVSAQASSGGPTAGGTYNWGSSANERAIGAMTSSGFASPNSLLTFFTNGGVGNITGFTISYDAERYRVNSTGTSIQFYYSLNGTTWIAVNAGDIAPSLFPTGSNSYTFAAPLTINRSGVGIAGLNISPGGNFYFRWNIITGGANSQGIGIDNISITAIGDAPPPKLTAGLLSGFGNVCVGSNSSANSFTLSGSNLDGSQVTVGPFANYSLSGTANGPFTSTLSPFYTGSSFSTTIYVRLSPTGVQFYDGNIPVTGGNAAAINVAATGAGINTIPTVASGNASSITQTTSTLSGSITDSGCGNISSCGVEYSTSNGFANGTGTFVSSSNLTGGSFSSFVSGLTAGTIYYSHSIAANSGGISYGTQKTFTTLVVDPITATSATGVTANGFTANFNLVSGAANYRLDVATTNTFVKPGNITLANWIFPNISDDAFVDGANAQNTDKTISAIGTNTPSFNVSGANTSAARATGWDLGNGIKYWQIEISMAGYYNLLLSSKQRSSSTGPKDFKVQYKVGAGAWTDLPAGTVTTADNFTTGVLSNKALPLECSNQSSVFIRWIMTSNAAVGGGSVGSTGASLIDDILVTGNATSCVTGYENLTVTNTSQAVAGLTPSTTYYYRVRAFDGNLYTPFSNVINVTTATNTALPIELIALSGIRQNNKNVLKWTTVSEHNNTGFEIHRSFNGVRYSVIAFIPSLSPDGESQDRLDYSFEDEAIWGERQFYRLRQVDKDGASRFSEVIMIQGKPVTKITVTHIYPNPATSVINAIIESPARECLTFEVFSIDGKLVKMVMRPIDAGSNSISIDLGNLATGYYLLRIVNSLGFDIYTATFILKG